MWREGCLKKKNVSVKIIIFWGGGVVAVGASSPKNESQFNAIYAYYRMHNTFSGFDIVFLLFYFILCFVLFYLFYFVLFYIFLFYVFILFLFGG